MLARFLQGFFEEKLLRSAAERSNPEKAEVGRAGEDSFERMTASQRQQVTLLRVP
jgi:hypothetical protein